MTKFGPRESNPTPSDQTLQSSVRGHPQPWGIKPQPLPSNQTMPIGMPPMERELLEDAVCDLDLRNDLENVTGVTC